MRARLLALAALASMGSNAVLAQSGPPPMFPAPAPPEPDAIPLYGKATPGSASTENWVKFMHRDFAVRNVTRPTLTPVLPDPAKATGAAVVVVPGGAFMMLAMDHEGWKVARALADRGIAAFVLKYRIIPTPKDEAEAAAFMDRKMHEGLSDPTKQPTLQYPPSTEDALAALRIVRSRLVALACGSHARGNDRISAGAMTSLNTVMAARTGEGPNFFGYIYGPQGMFRPRRRAAHVRRNRVRRSALFEHGLSDRAGLA